MAAGNSPFALTAQQLGGQSRYVLHHITPIQHGGAVYDMSNLLVVTPRYHLDILGLSFHYG